jgi:peptide/nickel transport system substrate-binding protein
VEIGSDRAQYARQTGAKQIGHITLFDSSPHSTYRVLREKISSREQGMWWQGVTDEVADRLIDLAHGLTDTAQRAAAYAHCLVWLRDHPHWLYLYTPVKVYATRSGVSGVWMDHVGYLRVS